MKIKYKAKSITISIICIVLLVIVLFPFLWIMISSFKTVSDVQKVPIEYFPGNPNIDTYKFILTDYRFGSWPRYLLNSLKIAVITTAIVTMASSLCGYAFSRFKFRWAGPLLLLLLVSQMFPGPSILIPMYKLIDKINLMDSHLALILINIAFTLPFAVWMSIGSYENIPMDLEEAAYIDGCSLMSAYWKVIFPVSKVGLISIALYTFIISWAEFIFSLVILETQEKMTIALKLGSMVKEITVNWNEVSAATVVVSLPLLAFFLWAQKYFIKGMVSGAVKG